MDTPNALYLSRHAYMKLFQLLYGRIFFQGFTSIGAGRLAQCSWTSLSAREVLGSFLGAVKLDAVSSTTCHRFYVSSELCCRGSLSRGVGSRYSLHASGLITSIMTNLYFFLRFLPQKTHFQTLTCIVQHFQDDYALC